jgi:hypothetical protein
MKVWIADIIEAISLFNKEGKNPYRELVPIKGHAPLLFELRTGKLHTPPDAFPSIPGLRFHFLPPTVIRKMRPR